MPQDQVLVGITEILGGVAGINQAEITPETSWPTSASTR